VDETSPALLSARGALLPVALDALRKHSTASPSHLLSRVHSRRGPS
jgi:hypothetical protein